MRAYGKICLTTHAPFGALHLSDPAFFGCRHPLDVPRSANHNKHLQKRLRGEHEAVQISEHSHSLYENARCTFNRSTHGFEPGPTMHTSVACHRKATLKLTLALAGAVPSFSAFTSVSWVQATYTSVMRTHEGIRWRHYHHHNSTRTQRTKPQWNRCILVFFDA